MKINFSNNDYKEVAKRVIKIKEFDFSKTLSKEDAFCLLIKDVEEKDISNIVSKLSIESNLKNKEAYQLIQNLKTKKEKELIFNIAIDLLEKNTPFGNVVVQGSNINSSAWISHSLYEGILSSNLAEMLNLNSEFAFTYGLLHDYGRKYSHDIMHVVKGFEHLVDMGLYNESKATLTHSFINGGRFNNNENAIDDSKDDVSEILENRYYNDYDRILNIADLMATSYGIVSPQERINDIASRRKNIDLSPNRKYFFLSFYNLLVYFLNRLNLDKKYQYIEDDKLSLEEVKEKFSNLSEIFYSTYLNYSKENANMLIKS